jgi:hypothetical protein
MSLPLCRSALKQLQAYSPGDGAPPGRRGLGRDDPGQLVRLAAAFARELVAAGAGGELDRRADLFVGLTEPDSAFEKARLDAHARLSSPGCKLVLPDYSSPPLLGRTRGVLVTRADGSLEVHRHVPRRNLVWTLS